MKYSKLAAGMLAASLAIPFTVAADGDDAQGTAAFESVAVTGGAGSIEVVGASTFGGEPVVVGSDAAGDAVLPGTDFGTATLTQDAASGLITAELELLDGLPEIATSPEGVFFEWNVDVLGGDGFAFVAKFIEQSGPGGWFFSINTFGTDASTGTGTFTTSAVTGEYNGTHLVWQVDPAQFGGAPGAKLIQGSRGPIRSSFGLAGALTFTLANYDDMIMDSFVIGGGARAVVRDAAGDEVDERVAKVRRGEFSVNFTDLEPGAYTVEVFAEYGDGGTSETFAVTVA